MAAAALVEIERKDRGTAECRYAHRPPVRCRLRRPVFSMPNKGPESHWAAPSASRSANQDSSG